MALRDVSLDLEARRTLAVVGESGAGKSTLARCLCRLEALDSGSIYFDGEDFSALRGRELRVARRRIQLVFQHSAMALNPRLRALDAVAEPLCIGFRLPRSERSDRALHVMQRVGLSGDFALRLPAELSGGQRQRLALARALISQPKVLILDEGMAGLDRATAERILDLLLELQSELALGYIFITHDLRIATTIASEIAVMHEGRVVDAGPVPDWIESSSHSASIRLLQAAAQCAPASTLS